MRETKNKVVTLRLTESDKATLTRIALEQGATVTALLTKLIQLL